MFGVTKNIKKLKME